MGCHRPYAGVVLAAKEGDVAIDGEIGAVGCEFAKSRFDCLGVSDASGFVFEGDGDVAKLRVPFAPERSVVGGKDDFEMLGGVGLDDGGG